MQWPEPLRILRSKIVRKENLRTVSGTKIFFIVILEVGVLEKQIIRISVRHLVEFILRSGDLDNRHDSSTDREAMQKGSRLHRKIQKRMGASYQPEVSLSHMTEYEEFSIMVEGRADGVIVEESGVTIDEIKGGYRDLSHMEGPVPVHLAQAKCYACFYGLKKYQMSERTLEDGENSESLDKDPVMKVQMTYCHLETEEIRRFTESYRLSELTAWFGELIDQYYRWAKWQYDWQLQRNASMVGLEFPFPYREGQRDVVISVYRTILRKKQLFIQAPTGVGKTMSTVFPAVRSMGEGLCEKIFYLTAKTITRTVAGEAFSILQKQGLLCKVLTITAKEKLCVCDEADCNPVHCTRAKGHYDRVNEAVFSALQTFDRLDREELLAWAGQYQVCPYEMCLDIADWVDAVICDYNYVFDPDVRLRRFFGEGSGGAYVFLIDEAHNLVERGREMYSAVLYKEDFLRIMKHVHDHSRKLERALEKSNKQLLELKRECETYQILDSVGPLALSLLTVMGELEDFLEEQEEGELRQEVLEFYFAVRSFVSIHELVDENYVIYTQHEEDGRFRIKLYCVNPANNLQKALDQGISTVYFSATLLPIRYYRSLLSGREDDYAIYAHTPFLPEQKAVLLGRDVSSRYTRRGPEEYAQIAGYIYEVARSHQGNYMIFFPSYRMLEDVLEVYERQYDLPGIQILVQNPSMEEEEREKFLSAFEVQMGQTVLGFCVMGGIFAEGIDLVGDRLVGAVIVGTGIPQISREREILKQHYDEKGENGFDYAYRFPGMNKVLQSAGRVIRSHEDRGIILLLDERFCSPDYRSLFPREWEQYQICTRKNVGKALQIFWDER